ncbi:Polynucleotide adenylyltransferase family protein [Zea mays]|uniref:Polynucleotide adenylyltransferase family protein n=1 Tax=Zea mays TaxID=4577 RepID=A0A1D6EC63_MAIZE|nr:Polynucleotide adenylyltransferase family protein [Zea mays]
MALRSPDLRWLGSLTRPGRLAPSPLAALASPRRRRRAPSPSPSPSDSSTPSTAPTSDSGPGAEGMEGLEWKKISAKRFGIKESMIPPEAWNVLHRLRSRVRLLGNFIFKFFNRTQVHTEQSLAILRFQCILMLPFDGSDKSFISDNPEYFTKVKDTFLGSAVIVGRRFPICHVHENNSIVEVSSFNTCARGSSGSQIYNSKSQNCSKNDFVRWKNCQRRDFTINGLMFNPYSEKIYDYLGGIEDIKKAKVRTVIPAGTSFQEDCARILRAIRIAARLGFSFPKETAYYVRTLACSVARLDKARILMEMNYMLAYGSAEASLRLLWRFGLLEHLLPFQAAYFSSTRFKRKDKGTNMLLVLFSKLDNFLAPNRPCHNSLWISLLAFHEALARKPCDPLIVATFALAFYLGGDMSLAVDIGKSINRQHDTGFRELLEPKVWTDKHLAGEVQSFAALMKQALTEMTDEYHVANAMAKIPQAPSSDLVCLLGIKGFVVVFYSKNGTDTKLVHTVENNLDTYDNALGFHFISKVFIPLQAYLKVLKFIECVQYGKKERGHEPKRDGMINYHNLSNGTHAEIRNLFTLVVFDTLYPTDTEDENDCSS